MEAPQKSLVKLAARRGQLSVGRMCCLVAKAVIFTSAQTRSAITDAANIVAQPSAGRSREKCWSNGARLRAIRRERTSRVFPRRHACLPFRSISSVSRLQGLQCRLLEGARSNFTRRRSRISISLTNGTLVYVPGEGVAEHLPLFDGSTGAAGSRRCAAWRRTGAIPSVSPDGRLLAVDIHDGTQSGHLDLRLGARHRSRGTRSIPSDDVRPIWSPDGTRIAFASSRDGQSVFNIYWQRADGTGDAERLTTSPTNPQYPSSFHPNGRAARVHWKHRVGNPTDVMMLPIDGDEKSGWKAGTPVSISQGAVLRIERHVLARRPLGGLSLERRRAQRHLRPAVSGPRRQVCRSRPRHGRRSDMVDDGIRVLLPQHDRFTTDGDALQHRRRDTFQAGKPMVLNETRLAVRPRAAQPRPCNLHPGRQAFRRGGHGGSGGAEDRQGCLRVQFL